MWIDPIVDELHRIRQAHAARFNDDLRAMVEDLRQVEATWPAPKIDPGPKPVPTRGGRGATETTGPSA